MAEVFKAKYAEPVRWKAARPRFSPPRLVLALVVGAVAVGVAGLILPGVHIKTFLGALEAAALIAVLNALLPPTAGFGFLFAVAVLSAVLAVAQNVPVLAITVRILRAQEVVRAT